MSLKLQQVVPGIGRELLECIQGPDGTGTIVEFAKEHGLDRYKLQKILKGRLQRMDVPFATALEKATGGRIPVSRWAIPANADPNDTIPGAPPSGAV